MPLSCGHRIQFKLYALDNEVHLGNRVERRVIKFSHDDLLEFVLIECCLIRDQMEGHKG